MRISKHQFQNQHKIRSQINSLQIIGAGVSRNGPRVLCHGVVSKKTARTLAESKAERRSCFSNRPLRKQRYEEIDGSEEHI